MLTVATLCGPRYEHFLPRWKGSVPIWAKKLVFTDDTKGIYEAKNKIVHECDTEYIWMVDVDDVINLKITKEDFEKLTEGKPDIIKLGNETGLWNYIFKTDFIKKCYDEIEEATGASPATISRVKRYMENYKQYDIFTRLGE